MNLPLFHEVIVAIKQSSHLSYHQDNNSIDIMVLKKVKDLKKKLKKDRRASKGEAL